MFPREHLSVMGEAITSCSIKYSTILLCGPSLVGSTNFLNSSGQDRQVVNNCGVKRIGRIAMWCKNVSWVLIVIVKTSASRRIEKPLSREYEATLRFVEFCCYY